mmetsp:Transcript_17008/g.36647  ORF Transcript_17008/g.36647 Transcript_17008/m.36647 type:complete len:81 (+) Transcript_17008:281-523(+)
MSPMLLNRTSRLLVGTPARPTEREEEEEDRGHTHTHTWDELFLLTVWSRLLCKWHGSVHRIQGKSGQAEEKKQRWNRSMT